MNNRYDNKYITEAIIKLNKIHAIHHIHVKTTKGQIFTIKHSKETITLKDLIKQINLILIKEKNYD